MKKFLILFVIAAASISIIACTNDSGEKYTVFAKCLKETGAKMYGAYWCPACAAQKKLFGKKAVKEISYIECDYRGKGANPILCTEKGIKAYPTWEFKDGSFESGVTTLEELSEKTGCSLPKDTETEFS